VALNDENYHHTTNNSIANNKQRDLALPDYDIDLELF